MRPADHPNHEDVTLIVTEQIVHEVTIPQKEYQRLVGTEDDLLDQVLADATSGEPRKGHLVTFVGITSRNWEELA